MEGEPSQHAAEEQRQVMSPRRAMLTPDKLHYMHADGRTWGLLDTRL